MTSTAVHSSLVFLYIFSHYHHQISNAIKYIHDMVPNTEFAIVLSLDSSSFQSLTLQNKRRFVKASQLVQSLRSSHSYLYWNSPLLSTFIHNFDTITLFIVFPRQSYFSFSFIFYMIFCLFLGKFCDFFIIFLFVFFFLVQFYMCISYVLPSSLFLISFTLFHLIIHVFFISFTVFVHQYINLSYQFSLHILQSYRND